MMNGKRYKVLVPIERDGRKYWTRNGSGYTNKDESLNVYLDSVPISMFAGAQLMFQLRELDEDDLRRRDEPSGRRGNGEPTSVGATSTIPF
jgi:hypothetical protein